MDATELFTAMFLVLSGLIVGYWLFYRDRSQEESARRQLKKENNDLRRSIQTSEIAFSSLEEKHGRQRGQLNVLQQLCDDWSSSRESSERERAQLETDLAVKSSRVSEFENQSREEKRKRIELEDQLHKLKEQQQSLRVTIEEQWRQKHAEASTALSKTTVDLKSVKIEQSAAAKQLHNANARIAALEAELKSSKDMIETATANASGLKQEYVSLESGLKSTNDQLKNAQAEIAKALSEKDAALKSTAESEKKLAVLETEAESLRVEIQTLKQEMESVKSKLESSQQQLVRVTEQRDQALELEKAAGVVSSGLQKRLDNQESTIHMLRQSQDDALENLKHELKVRNELEGKFDARLDKLRSDYDAQIAALRQEIDEDTSETQIKDLREQLSRQAAQYAHHSRDLRAQLDEKRKEVSKFSVLETDAATYSQSIVKLDAKREQLQLELDTARKQMQAQLKQDSETIGVLQRERDELRSDLEQLHLQIAPLQDEVASHRAFTTELEMSQTRVGELERSLVQREQESKRLVAQANELERLRQRYQDARERQDKLQIQLDEMVSRQINRESDKANDIARIRELEAQLNAATATIEDLRKERALVLATLADQRQAQQPEATIISFTQSMDPPVADHDDYDQEYGGRMRRDANRGLVFTETPDSCDDLKRISGIAEVLEKRLNDFGVFTFKQVMDWQPHEIEEFSRLLAFRDRIDRDDWQGQARFFYNQKRQGVRSAA